MGVMMEKRSGVYCIENLVNGKRYIGQGQDVEKRAKRNHRECKFIYCAIKKYGKENFKRYIILYCEIEELNYYETECIKIYHSHFTENGYNIAWGGDAPMRDRNHSEESIEKIKKNHWDNSGENHPMFGKTGENNPNFGRHRSDETKERMRGKRSSMSGENHPMFGKTGENNPNFGSHRSDETKKKMSDSKSGENHPMFGKPRSDETKKKISVGMSGENNPMFGKTGENNPNFGKKLANSSSKYFGVSKERKSWQIRTCVNGKEVRIGRSKDEILAAKMYDNYVIENNLPNPLNFPEDYPDYMNKFKNKK